MTLAEKVTKLLESLLSVAIHGVVFVGLASLYREQLRAAWQAACAQWAAMWRAQQADGLRYVGRLWDDVREAMG